MDFKLKKSNLNLRVYTAAVLPSSGNENDIVVISDTPMTDWILSPDAPNGAPRTDGDVWITYTIAGNTTNILKQNAMMTAFISAKQYVNGAWVDKEAKSYQNGEWVDWYNGDTVFDRTRQTFSDITANLKECYENTGYIYAVDSNPYIKLTTKADNGIPRTMQWKVPIDFSKYDTLEVVGYGSSTTCYFGITDSLKSTPSNYTQIATHGKENFATSRDTLILSLDGVNITGYIGFYLEKQDSCWIERITLK